MFMFLLCYYSIIDQTFLFLAIDWDHISRSTPPMKPSAKDINTATQSEIGSFQDEKVSKKLILTEDDHKMYEKWDFLSKRSFQEEVVDFLTFEERVVSFQKFIFFLFFFFSFPLVDILAFCLFVCLLVRMFLFCSLFLRYYIFFFIFYTTLFDVFL